MLVRSVIGEYADDPSETFRVSNKDEEVLKVLQRKYPRSAVRSVACPYCRAQPNEKCIGMRSKPRESNHMERVRAYDRLQ